MASSGAKARWSGGLKGGKGRFEAGSGAFAGDYSFATRFEGAAGTNPEELLAAAHAACFSMALALGLEQGGTPATHIDTRATCRLQKGADGFRITHMRLETSGVVPGIDEAAFHKAAETAKAGCPVSKALAGNLEVQLDAKLER